jgi:hypothetical protein
MPRKQKLQQEMDAPSRAAEQAFFGGDAPHRVGQRFNVRFGRALPHSLESREGIPEWRRSSIAALLAGHEPNRTRVQQAQEPAAPGPGRASDAVDLLQALGPLRVDTEHRLAERPGQFLGVDRPDALDHAGGEVLLDALGRGRRRRAEEVATKLYAVRPVNDPPSARTNSPAPMVAAWPRWCESKSHERSAAEAPPPACRLRRSPPRCDEEPPSRCYSATVCSARADSFSKPKEKFRTPIAVTAVSASSGS